MKVIKGDLINFAKQGYFDIIVHGCNCANIFGAGIAKQIKREFPKAYEADKHTEYGSKEKLGNYSSVNVNNFIIVNAYTQYNIGYGSADYDAIKNVFNKINKDFNGLRIGYPKIGCGLAGGNWNIVKEIIDEELDGQDHTLVEYNQ